MSESVTYSLWFEPNGEVAYKIGGYIRKLSKKYDTPLFSPHVTLLGGLSASEVELVPYTNMLAASITPFKLMLTRTGYRNRYYQSLFVHVEDTNRLQEIRDRACRLFGLENEAYTPHLSLMYGDLSKEEKERILNLIGREFQIPFMVKSISLVNTSGEPISWRRVHTAVFKE
jgi:2'-5' RNA ligase